MTGSPEISFSRPQSSPHLHLLGPLPASKEQFEQYSSRMLLGLIIIQQGHFTTPNSSKHSTFTALGNILRHILQFTYGRQRIDAELLE